MARRQSQVPPLPPMSTRRRRTCRWAATCAARSRSPSTSELPVTTLKVRNTGDRPVQVGSHFHFFEVNRALEFDRAAAFGLHLNIPSSTAMRFEPGDEREVKLVPYGGKRAVYGFNNLVDGPTAGKTAAARKSKAVALAAKRGFRSSAAEDVTGKR